MQSKWDSFIEQCLNVFSGYVLSFLLWVWVIVPIWQIPVDMYESAAINLVFTVVSVIRGYIWRRYFNFRDLKKFGRVYDGRA